MIFDPPCREARLIKRYKRFLADLEFDDGTIATAHCPNTGSMKTCMEAGGKIFVSESKNPDRKLKWTWEFSEFEDGLVGVNTSLPNKIVWEALKAKTIPTFEHYDSLKTEVKYGSQGSRIDILLESPGKCFIEVKNATLFDNQRNCILFPDAVTTRGQKHLRELSEQVQLGHRAVLLFLVNRRDGDFLSVADQIDPEYGRLLRESSLAGVEIMAFRVESSPAGISVSHAIPIHL